MSGSRKNIPLWRRIPRVVYWIVGGTIALFGAFLANAIAGQVPLQQKFYVWMVGSIFIFGGLIILSMGTKSRLAGDDEDDEEQSPPRS